MGDITSARLRQTDDGYVSRDGYRVQRPPDDEDTWVLRSPHGSVLRRNLDTIDAARNVIATDRILRSLHAGLDADDDYWVAFAAWMKPRLEAGEQMDLLLWFRQWKAEGRHDG